MPSSQSPSAVVMDNSQYKALPILDSFDFIRSFEKKKGGGGVLFKDDDEP